MLEIEAYLEVFAMLGDQLLHDVGFVSGELFASSFVFGSLHGEEFNQFRLLLLGLGCVKLVLVCAIVFEVVVVGIIRVFTSVVIISIGVFIVIVAHAEPLFSLLQDVLALLTVFHGRIQVVRQAQCCEVLLH